MSLLLYSLACAVLLGLVLIIWLKPGSEVGRFYPSYTQAEVVIGRAVFHVVIADSAGRRVRGLSGCANMNEDQGMLFKFPVAMRYRFHMKGMRFPLDIIWIRSGCVVDIHGNVPPAGSGLHVFNFSGVRPRSRADAVLEVNAGSVDRFGIKIGDAIRIKSHK